MKNALKFTAVGVAIAMFIFLLAGVIFDITFQGTFALKNYAFSKMTLGTICIGIGFGLPSIIYDNDRMPMLLKVVLHMGIGSIVSVVVSSLVGWYPQGQVFPIVAGQLALAFLIWFGFYLHNKHLSKQMNQKIELHNKNIQS